MLSSTGSYVRTLGDPRNLNQCNLSPGSGAESFFPLTAKPGELDRYSFVGDLHVAGVRFSVRTAGFATGIRYVEPGDDTRTHVAKIWGPDRSLLYSESIDIDSCKAGDWVNVTFARPVYLAEGSGYIASIDNLYAYASTAGGFGAARTGGSLSLDPSSAGHIAKVVGLVNDVYPGDSPGTSTNYW